MGDTFIDIRELTTEKYNQKNESKEEFAGPVIVTLIGQCPKEK